MEEKHREVKYNPHYIMSRVRTISLTVFITVDVNLDHLAPGGVDLISPPLNYSVLLLPVPTVLFRVHNSH